MGLTQDPDVTFVKRWDRGIPSYAPGHIANVDAIFARADAVFEIAQCLPVRVREEQIPRVGR